MLSQRISSPTSSTRALPEPAGTSVSHCSRYSKGAGAHTTLQSASWATKRTSPLRPRNPSLPAATRSRRSRLVRAPALPRARSQLLLLALVRDPWAPTSDQRAADAERGTASKRKAAILTLDSESDDGDDVEVVASTSDNVSKTRSRCQGPRS